MKKQISILILVCASLLSKAQANFVKNPSFEQFSKCPDGGNQIRFANNWSDIIDSSFSFGSEYFNKCSNIYPDVNLHVPYSGIFYQHPRSGNGMALGNFFYDKSIPSPPSPLPSNYRDYIQGRLISKLVSGKTYCISFWINYVECSGYAHNKMGVLLDNGDINKFPVPAGSEILTLAPQLYTDSILNDSLNWIKIEGSFNANGTENHITIGNFFANALTTYIPTNYCSSSNQYSIYLIDDVSVIPIDLAADAGKDTWVEVGKQVQIGRVGDTTAQGLNCKWYKKGTLIDSGAIITVNANSSINAIDTYVVVQNICGVIKRDSVNVKTTGLGISELNFENAISIYPNPSNGNFTIACFAILKASITAKVYDLLGRMVYQEPLNFSNKEATLKLNIPSGSYILELKDEAGNVQRERIVIE